MLDVFCPLCGSFENNHSISSEFQYNNIDYHYRICVRCGTAFINPVPTDKILTEIYQKEIYHDKYYTEKQISGHEYHRPLELIKKILKPGAKVLDYGCGVGYFVRLLKNAGYNALGAEYDDVAAKDAAYNTGCQVFSLDELNKITENQYLLFDCVYLGSVFSHLKEPLKVIHSLARIIKPGGYLIMDGPIQKNQSLTAFILNINAHIKHLLGIKEYPVFPPYIQFMGSRKSFIRFIEYNFGDSFDVKHNKCYETGWSFVNTGSMLKELIGRLSITLSVLSFGYYADSMILVAKKNR